METWHLGAGRGTRRIIDDLRERLFSASELVRSQEACRSTTSTEVDKCNLGCVGLFVLFCSFEILFQARRASEIHECEMKVF